MNFPVLVAKKTFFVKNLRFPRSEKDQWPYYEEKKVQLLAPRKNKK